MGRKILRLTESDIKNIIRETVYKIIESANMDNEYAQNDMIEGFYQNGASRMNVNTEENDFVETEIQGVSGQMYFLKIYLSYSKNDILGDYYTPDDYETNTTIDDIEVTYDIDDEEYQVFTLNYVKNEEFEHDLLKYIDVDYSDYDSINHDSQFPY